MTHVKRICWFGQRGGGGRGGAAPRLAAARVVAADAAGIELSEPLAGGGAGRGGNHGCEREPPADWPSGA